MGFTPIRKASGIQGDELKREAMGSNRSGSRFTEEDTTHSSAHRRLKNAELQ
jgi:hypothetical protein